MATSKTELARSLYVLALGLMLFTDGSTTGHTAESKAARNQQPPGAAHTVGRWWIATMGEIRAVPTADGSKVNCSEVLDLGRPATIKSLDIYRNVYVVDAARKTFATAAPSMRVPQRTSTWSEGGGRRFDGKKELILATWECTFPRTKDLHIVVSLAVVRLSDGREEVCRFRPLLIANGTILTREEEGEKEEGEKNEKVTATKSGQ